MLVGLKAQGQNGKAKLTNIRHGHGPRRGCNAVKKITYAIYSDNPEKNKLDPDMQCDYTGCDYYVQGPVTLHDASRAFVVKTPQGFLSPRARSRRHPLRHQRRCQGLDGRRRR